MKPKGNKRSKVMKAVGQRGAKLADLRGLHHPQADGHDFTMFVSGFGKKKEIIK